MFKKYQIANGMSEAQLIQVVNNAMQEGWQPVGGVTAVPIVVNGVQQYQLLQALVHV